MNVMNEFEIIEEQNFSVEYLELSSEESMVLRMNQKYRQSNERGLYYYLGEEN